MARRDSDNDNLISKLRQMSEEGIASFFNELLSNDKMRSSFGRAGERFMSNKQSFDRNVEQLIASVNCARPRPDRRSSTARVRDPGRPSTPHLWEESREAPSAKFLREF